MQFNEPWPAAIMEDLLQNGGIKASIIAKP